MECQRGKFSPHGVVLSSSPTISLCFQLSLLCFLINVCHKKERKKKKKRIEGKKITKKKGNFQNCCSREPRDHPLIAVRRNVANDCSKKKQNPSSPFSFLCIWQINSTFVIYLSKMFFSSLMRVKKLRCSFARVVARDTNVLVTVLEKLCVSSWWRTGSGRSSL